MPRSYQIKPKYGFSHVETFVNDNSIVADDGTTTALDSTTSMLLVFASPKGRDNKIVTLPGGNGPFKKSYGLGPHSLYGQPLMNAYAAANSGGATLHCLRVTAPDAAYAMSALVAKYKIEEKKMTIKFSNKPADTPLKNLAEMDAACTVTSTADTDGFTPVKLMSVAYIGKGTYGNSLAYKITSDGTTDKTVMDYKNYAFSVLSNDTSMIMEEESFPVTFVEDALVSNQSVYATDVINDEDTGSALVRIEVYPDAFAALFAEYKKANPDTNLTLEKFDCLCGINRDATRGQSNAIENLVITTEDASGEVVIPNTMYGLKLHGGDDGAFAATADAATRKTALDAAYLKAFSGGIDEFIKSRYRFPTTFIVDAGFNSDIKKQIIALAIQRKDCVAIMDAGLDITLKSSVLNTVDTLIGNIVAEPDDPGYDELCKYTVEAYCLKARDPYSKKVVTLTGTHWICANYPVFIRQWGGKHKPMAGNTYGAITGYIKNSIYPVFDESIDAEMMEDMHDAHINYAKYSPSQVVVRAAQDTRQTNLSNLSELSNVLVLLDIQRDADILMSKNEYDFNEPSNVALYNNQLTNVTDKYKAAQVASITAEFGRNAWEAARGIGHLVIGIWHKDILRTVLVELDVNRADA